MAKIIRVERLVFCGGDEKSTLTKGAGWVVRTSDLRVCDVAGQDGRYSAKRDRGLSLQILSSVRKRIDRKYRILRRKGVASIWQRMVASLSRSLRPQVWN